jgi:hypothetical protein
MPMRSEVRSWSSRDQVKWLFPSHMCCDRPADDSALLLRPRGSDLWKLSPGCMRVDVKSTYMQIDSMDLNSVHSTLWLLGVSSCGAWSLTTLMNATSMNKRLAAGSLQPLGGSGSSQPSTQDLQWLLILELSFYPTVVTPGERYAHGLVSKSLSSLVHSHLIA